MKKLFTLMMLLVAIVTGAWADGAVVYKSDFTNGQIIQLSQTYVDAASTGGSAWITLSSSTTGKVTASSPEAMNQVTVYRVKQWSSRYLEFWVKGVSKLTFYANHPGLKDGAAKDTRIMKATVNQTSETSAINLVDIEKDATVTQGSGDVILDPTVNNKVRVYATGDMDLYAMVVTVPESDKDPSTFEITSDASVTLWKGETSTITYENNAGTVTFESSATGVATVSDAGVITAVGEGSATITVTDPGSETVDGAEKTVAVTVKEHKNTSTENIPAAAGSSILDNSGTISSDSRTLSFANEPMSIVGTANFQSGSNNYKFIVDEEEYAAVKVAKNGTYTIKPKTGYTITSAAVYASSNSDTKSAISSPGKAEQELSERGTSGTPVAKEAYVLGTNELGEYEFTISGSASQAIVVLKVAYSAAKQMIVTIKETGYATLFTDYAVTIPEGVNAYTAKFNGTKDAVVLKKVNNIIPANTAVILNTETPDTYSFVGAENVAAVTGNVLEGTLEDTAVEANTVYTLGLGSNNTVGMRNYTGTSLRAYSAFITKNTNGLESLSMEFEDATAINNVNANDNANSIAPVKVIKNGKLFIGNYNVAGQQVK